MLSYIPLLFFLLLININVFAESSCERIISLTPSITEIIYELGLDKHLIAVSEHDSYPPDVINKAKLNSVFNLNIEEVYKLKPDIVFSVGKGKLQQLKHMKINYQEFSHNSLQDIFSSIKQIGITCKAEEKANQVLGKIKEQIESLKCQTANPLKVLIAISPSGLRNIKNFYFSGNNGIYQDILALFGVKNVIQQKTIPFSSLSYESLIKLNPDLIIELNSEKKYFTQEQILKPWEQLNLQAVRNKQVYLLNQDYVFIPGTRIVNLIKDFRKIVCLAV